MSAELKDDDEKLRESLHKFVSSIAGLVQNLLKDPASDSWVETTFGGEELLFGSTWLEALEFLGNIVFKQMSKAIIWTNLFSDLLSLIVDERFPNASIAHIKVVEIFKSSLKEGDKDLVEHILYESGLVKNILALKDEQTWTYPGSGRTESRSPKEAFLLELADFLK